MHKNKVMKKIRLGIVGAGRFADTHMQHFSKIKDVEIVAASRTNEKRLSEFQKKWKINSIYTDYEEMMTKSNIDGVIIITPTNSHKDITLSAIDKGLHVLCEKPLALSAKDCKIMLDSAEKKGVIHSTNFNQRGNTSLGKIMRYIDRDFVGRIFHANIWWGMSHQYDARPDTLAWRFKSEYGGGSVYELIHVFDMLRFINGEISRIVSTLDTTTKKRPTADYPEGINVDVPDASGFLCEWVNGGFAVVHTSFASRGTDPDGSTSARIEISGEKGKIATNGKYLIEGITGNNGPILQLDPGPEYAQPYSLFVEAIKKNDQKIIDTSFYDGLKAAEIVDAAYESFNKSKWIEISHT